MQSNPDSEGGSAADRETAGQNRQANLDDILIGQRHDSDDPRAVDERAVLAAEILDRSPVLGDDDSGVPPGHAPSIDLHRRLLESTDDVCTSFERNRTTLPEKEVAVRL